MNNQNLLKGLCLIAIALFFGLQSFKYSLGNLAKAGPGLFPLMVSGLLFVIGAAIVLRSTFIPAKPMTFQYRNIALISVSLIAFAIISEYVNMLVGLVAMVMLASRAADDFSFARAAKITGVLVLIAFAMRKGLGFQLPLY